MAAGSVPKLKDQHSKLSSEMQEAISRRAREIYEKSGKVAGHDVENWVRAEAEVLGERTHSSARRAAVVVRVEGVRYVGEYQPGVAGYSPGEFAQGDPVPVRFAGDKMYLKRPNGKELETRIVNKAG
jgi:hypothetical protein